MPTTTWRSFPRRRLPMRGSRFRRALTNASRCIRALATAFAIAAPTLLWALDPQKALYQYNLRSWTWEDGLPAARVNAIAQSNDGYIWLGMAVGLVRFDGNTFKTFKPNFTGAKGIEVRGVVASRRGGLRVVVQDGGGATFDGNHFSPIENPRWPADLTGKCVLESADGAVWMGWNSGVTRWSDGREAANSFRRVSSRVFALAEDAAHRIWIGTEGDGLATFREGKLDHFADPVTDKSIVRAIAFDRAGNMWVAGAAGVFCYDANGAAKKFQELGKHPAGALLVDRENTVWIGTTSEGLARYRDGQVTFLRENSGLASDGITALCEDAEGSLWVGSSRGLTQISDVKFPTFTGKSGLTDGIGHSVLASHDGRVWYSSGQGLSCLEHVADTYRGTRIAQGYAAAIHEARNGDLYFSLGRNLQVLRGNKLDRYPTTRWPQGVTEDSQSLIVALDTELFRLIDGALVPYEYKGAPPRFDRLTCLTVLDDDAIWVASYRGVYRIKDGEFHNWSTGSGLPAARAHFLAQDVDKAVWIATTGGLARLKDGTIRSIRQGDGLPSDRINAFVADNAGTFWIDSGAGYFRISRQNLNDFVDGKTRRLDYVLYDYPQAVKNIDRTDEVQFSADKTPDGRIWFPNSAGLVMIDPTNIATNSVPPPVHIQEVRVNGDELTRDRSRGVLQVGENRLEFAFAALSYLAPQQLRIEYRLDGFEDDWTVAGTRRSAAYRVPPGRYTFRVRAWNADGVAATEEDTLTFEVPPPFYATTWFYGAVAAAVLLAVLGIHRWRVMALKARQAELQARVDERTAELAYERELFRALLDNSPDCIYFKDRESRIVKCCRSYASRFHAKSPDDLVGKTDFDLYDAAQAQPAFEDEQRVVQTGEPLLAKVEKEVWADGRITWALSTKMPWRDVKGNIVGTFGLSKDITSLKESEAKLIDLHKQLIETSRQAGMAEIATGILHNVGNVLNSANVSVATAITRMRSSRLQAVAKVAAMLQEHSADLAAYLTADPKGQKVPAYLTQLGEVLAGEQQQMLTELNHLQKSIDHINEIVALQQNVARVAGITEITVLAELVDDAIRVSGESLDRHHIELNREFDRDVSITVDRHKVLQIVINLIRNAKHACDESGRKDKRIILRVAREHEGAKIEVIDNGIGIAPENMRLIFTHGFTTRKGGHGFGLHSSVITARALGGNLTVHSAGPMTGATFSLRLPLNPPAGTSYEDSVSAVTRVSA